LSLAVVVCMAAGLVMGPVVSRFRRARITIVFCIAAAVMITWMTVLLWPGQPPFWLVVVLVVVTPLGGPASNVGFDEARLSSPRSYLGLATSVVNIAAFVSPLIAMLLIGVVLDLLGAGSPEHYSLDAFRWAMMAMLPIWLIGLTGIVIESRRTKHWNRHRDRAAE
jgi:MFS family permease